VESTGCNQCIPFPLPIPLNPLKAEPGVLSAPERRCPPARPRHHRLAIKRLRVIGRPNLHCGGTQLVRPGAALGAPARLDPKREQAEREAEEGTEAKRRNNQGHLPSVVPRQRLGGAEPQTSRPADFQPVINPLDHQQLPVTLLNEGQHIQ